MKNNRNLYLDLLRTVALVYMLLYHIYAVSGLRFKTGIINDILSMGGEIGVSMFFIISGFGIYKLLNKAKDSFSYKNYLIGRFRRIGPHYYICIFVVLLLTPGAVYLSLSHLFDVLLHCVFFHNLFYNYHGQINGVLWTMGVTVQFYLLAPFIKKMLDKKPKITLLLAMLLTIIFRYIVLFVVDVDRTVYPMFNFIYGRQFITAMSSFVIGMFVSKYEGKSINNKNFVGVSISVLFLIFWILIGANTFDYFSLATVDSSSYKGLIYYVVLDVIIGSLIYFLCNCKYYANKFFDFLLVMAKHEYSIYIWHLLILNSLIAYSGLYGNISRFSILATYIVLLILLVLTGIIIDKFICNVDFKKKKSS